MKIEILGDGCAKCMALDKHVQQAMDDLGIHAEIIHVSDPLLLADLESPSLPQLMIDGQLAPPEQLDTVARIRTLLRTATLH